MLRMNDSEIRTNLHQKVLRKHHVHSDTLVIDELGLQHGAFRADIVVVKGHLAGIEIKSDEDTLSRLDDQVAAYDAVFDRSTAVVGARHVEAVIDRLPEWWGVMLARRGTRGAVRFSSVRRAGTNKGVDAFSVAQLLWHTEAAGILSEMGAPGSLLRQPRAVLYGELVEALPIRDLRRRVRDCLRGRADWRHPSRPSRYGGSFRPTAK